MKLLKRWIKMMLVVCLLINAVPGISVFAETEDPEAVNDDAVEEVLEESINDDIIDTEQPENLFKTEFQLDDQLVPDNNLDPDTSLDNSDLEDDSVFEKALDDEILPVDESNPDNTSDNSNPDDESNNGNTLEEPLPEAQQTENAIETVLAMPTEFIRAFAIDCGRLYFSVAQIKDIIDEMALYDYTHLTLAFGNSGFRFLLDDMTIGNYASDNVKNAIRDGNTYYAANDGHKNSSAPNTCLTESEMNEIIAYANNKGIEIIPALNSPGHMNTIVRAMKLLNVATYTGYIYNGTLESVSTINISDNNVKAFVGELIQKYIDYFASKGCTMFNLGADEFTNDPTDTKENGEAGSFNDSMKSGFISYVNSVADRIVASNMIPMMFNDGYAWADANFNKNIVICYWNSGSVSSETIANAGHKIINNSRSFYYVLGSPFGEDGWCSYASATNGVNNVSVTTLFDNGDVGDNLVGAQMFLWCDYTDEVYTAEEAEKVKTLIRTLAIKNPAQFKNLPKDLVTRDITVLLNDNATEIITGDVYTDFKIQDSSIAFVELTTIPATDTVVDSTAVTQLENGATYVIRIHNTTNALSSDKGSTAWNTDTLAFQTITDNSNNSKHFWTLEASGEGYKLKNFKGYLNLGSGNNSAYLDENGEVFTITSSDTGWYIGNSHGKYINNLDGAGSAGGWTGSGTRFDLYKVIPGFEDSTAVKITGLKAGTTQVTVGHVTYNVTIADATEHRPITLRINQTLTDNIEGIAIDGDCPTNDQTIATASAKSTGSGTAEQKTTVTFTGKSAGTTHVTIGEVYYTITVLENEKRLVIIHVGETSDPYTHASSEATNQTPDESIATLTIDPGEKIVTITPLTSGDSITEGKYVISKSSELYLTNNSKKLSDYSSNNGLALSNVYTVWEFEKNNSNYYIKDPNSKYLTFNSNNNASVGNTKGEVTVATSSNNVFTIQQGNYRLTYNTSNVAYGYRNSYSNNLWQISSYSETDNPKMQISFTGVTPGTTYASIGNVDYTIKVLSEDVTVERVITLHVNQTLKDVIKNANVSGKVETEDSLIATAIASSQHKEASRKVVQVTKKEDIVEGGQYLIVANQSGKALTPNVYTDNQKHLAMDGEATADNPNLWTITENGSSYYFSPYNSSNQYLTFANTTAGIATNTNNATKINLVPNADGTWKIKQLNANMYLTDNKNNGQHANGYSVDDSTAIWKIYKLVEEEASYETTVSFTGKSIGTTYAVVDRVFYTIHVEEEDLSLIYLTYNPWLSNYSMYPEGTGNNLCTNDIGVANPQQIVAESVAFEQGVAFESLVWATGDWRWEESTTQTHFWKGTILPEGKHQEGDADDDRCMDGIDFNYIRYWNSVWSYSIDRVTWTEILPTDEVCAYYLQETEVTTEVETFVKDWAFLPDLNTNTELNRHQKALSIAVVYPGGTMNPTEDQIYLHSTLIYWDNLEDLGFIRFAINTEYEVEKITYTFGERKEENRPAHWNTEDDIVWEKTSINGDEWYDETLCWDPSYGTEPVVDGDKLVDVIYAGESVSGAFNGSWGADDAVLLLVYLKPVVTEDSLKVIYFDEKFGEELTNYTITVKHGDSFDDMGKVDTSDGSVILDTNEEAPAFEGNPERIDVTDFGIINNLDIIQRFQTNLTMVPNVMGKYNSELYIYTGSEITDDGKTLYLYYNVNTQALTPNYVIDFGVPVRFELKDIVNDTTVSLNSIQVTELSAHYGTLTYDNSNYTFTYTPTTILQSVDVLSIALTFDTRAANTTVTHVGIFPSTTVHYEESFITWDSNWATGNEPITVGYQQTETLPNKDDAKKYDGKKYNYGYDPIYAGATGASNGTHATATKVGAIGTFTFTGNGIQIFANCTEQTGYVAVQVNDSSGKIVNLSMVDTVVKGGSTGATTGQTGNMDGLPVVSLIDLQNMDHGTYTVTIRKIMDTDPVNIDGIRVFNTRADSTIYTPHLEDNPNFYELRDMVLHAVGVNEDTSVDYKTMVEQVYNATKGATALVTDSTIKYADSNTIQDLLDNGPKNELYLYPDQTLTFKLTTNRVVQIGLKAPKNSTSAILTTSYTTADSTVTKESNLTLDSTVDMFYSVVDKATERTYTVTIENTGEDIVAVTLLKICDDPNVIFEELNEADIEMALFGRDSSDVTDSEITGPGVHVPEIINPETETGETPDTDLSSGSNGTENKESVTDNSSTSEGDIESDTETIEPEDDDNEVSADNETDEPVQEIEPEITLSFFERLIQFICDFLASIANWIFGIFA